MKVFPSLIKRSKTHFHKLPIGANVILGNNGFVWIYPVTGNEEDSVGGFIQNLEEVGFVSIQEHFRIFALL